MIKQFSFSVVFIALTLFVNAQDLIFSENCKQAYLDISALEFDKATQILEREKKQHPQNYLPVLYENYLEFLKVVIGEREEEYDAFRDKKRQRIRDIRDADDESPYYLYALANLNLHFAFAHLRFEDYFPAMFEIKRAFHLLERNVEKYPDFIPNYIGMGLLHTMVGSIPENYKWVAWLASMDGTVEQGSRELFMVLEKAQNNPEYSHLLTEAVFFITFMEMNMGSDKANAEKLLAILEKESNHNPLIVYSKVSILRKTSRNEDAIAVLEKYEPSSTAYPYHYLTYLKGLLYLHRLDQDGVKFFEEYIHNYSGAAFIKASYQKLAWFALLRDDRNEYFRLIKKCLAEGSSHVDNDEQAEREAEKEQPPNIHLLKARLLYDGGYYQRSVESLKQSDPEFPSFSDDQKTEYYYRFGRNYQGLELTDTAKFYLKKAIVMGEDSKEYFAGNSAIQLGHIYENANQLDSAAYYYEVCLDLDFKTYKRSLDIKAKASLDRIETKKGNP